MWRHRHQSSHFALNFPRAPPPNSKKYNRVFTCTYDLKTLEIAQMVAYRHSV